MIFTFFFLEFLGIYCKKKGYLVFRAVGLVYSWADPHQAQPDGFGWPKQKRTTFALFLKKFALFCKRISVSYPYSTLDAAVWTGRPSHAGRPLPGGTLRVRMRPPSAIGTRTRLPPLHSGQHGGAPKAQAKTKIKSPPPPTGRASQTCTFPSGAGGFFPRR